MDFQGFDVVTFDCYGTLIDWERGIREAALPVFGAHGKEMEPQALLELFARLEPEAERSDHGFRSYREVLERVMERMGEEVGFVPTPGERAGFAASVATWPPFPDTVAALRALADRYRLAVVSNVDDDLFAGSAAQLGVRFDELVTAQQVRSYKPAHAHFHEVLRRLGVPRQRVLHVAQSLYHDIGPANQLGISSVWINRRAGREGGGATPPATAMPDLEVPSLAALVEIMGL
ncbi:MAG: haloacid dehalogenase type II [Gemmatimonadota bacterium]|nr:haloacid dehalogenase type II [Gemmatimonadota bacterium]